MQALSEILYTNNLSKSYKEPVRYTSVALCAVGTSVTLHYLRPLRDSVCLLYKILVYPPYFGRASYYPVSMSFIILLPCLEYPVPCLPFLCYHVSYYPVPCLPLPCYHVSYYSVPCLPLPCYHVSLYPVPCLPLPCLHQGMQNHKKRVDKLIISRSHTPQNN